MGRKRKTSPGLGKRLASLVGPEQTQQEFAEFIGVPGQTLGNYLRGNREPSFDFLLRLRQKTDIDINWLLTGVAEEEEQKTYAVPGFGKEQTQAHVLLPRYDIQASAGHGAFADRQEAADHLIVSRDWLSRYVRDAGRVVVVEAHGDSMEPTIRHGDLLMVEMGVDRENVAAAGGGVFVIAVAGMIMVKRLQVMLDGDLTISSDNRAYRAETVLAAERDDKVIVHGRVFWSGGPLASR